MTLAELATEEERLMAHVRSLTGSMEEKQAQLARDGVFDAYARVHTTYVDLAMAGDMEALKRALFLQWYAVSEPGCFTGLWEMMPEAERCVLERVEQLVATDSLDSELVWMLPYYHSISDWYFDQQEGLPLLTEWLRERAHRGFPDGEVQNPALDGRGQMSEYWFRPDEPLPPSRDGRCGSGSGTPRSSG